MSLTANLLNLALQVVRDLFTRIPSLKGLFANFTYVVYDTVSSSGIRVKLSLDDFVVPFIRYGQFYIVTDRSKIVLHERGWNEP